MDTVIVTKKKSKKGRRSGKANRQHKFKLIHPGRCRQHKDRNVFRSSHGKFKTVAELEAHRLSVTAA